MLNYSLGSGEFEDWIISDVDFSPNTLGKSESIMYLGNGYMGLRSSTEEPYLKEKRNLFVNGTFNKADPVEVTELPNIADVTRLDIRVDGDRFSLEQGHCKKYMKQLNLKTAELTRTVEWTSPKGKELSFHFKRFVSMDDFHLIGMKMEVESLSHPVDIAVDSGINGQMTNSGVQHFLEGERRVYKRRLQELIQKTNESGVDVMVHTTHNVRHNKINNATESKMDMGRRKVWMTYQAALDKGDCWEIEKISSVFTSRDQEFDQQEADFDDLRAFAISNLEENAEKGYDALAAAHQKAWQKNVWDTYNFSIKSENSYDLLALRFAIYHLTVMAPSHDDRMGIGAKALSGEGYKGHSFWDTEIFILPFFTFSNPETAKSLLKYRYHGLAGARQKALENGYKGAMYPWESAWPTDGEVTPQWGDVDIVTGEQSKILSGFIEQHITADIAFAVYQYMLATDDKEFLSDYGYEIIFDTANFWASRLEWDTQKKEYHINNVIGPDEYKEHVNNNAYTNYMAYFNMKLAVRYYEKLMREDPEKFTQLDSKLKLSEAYRLWGDRIGKLYLPVPGELDNVIAQDDTYMDLEEIDLTKYKDQQEVRGIYKDYNAEQINKLQVTKQADVLTLIYLIEQTFLNNDPVLLMKIKESNFHFYEPRTLQDSSLSLAIHAIIANDIGKEEYGYQLFKEACEIDLGPLMKTSDDGVHAASIGGIWSSAVFGFAGVRIVNEKLSINPSLPKHWNSMKFSFYWQGSSINLSISGSTLSLQSDEGEMLELEVAGRTYVCDGYLEVPISNGEENII